MMPERGRRRQVHHALLTAAVEVLTDLTDHAPDVPDYRHLMALCLREMSFPRQRGLAESGEARLDRAIAILETLVADFPDVPRYRLDLAETYTMQDESADTVPRLQTAAQIVESLIRERPNVPSYRSALGHVYLRTAHGYARLGRLDAAIAVGRRALAIQTELSEDFPHIKPMALMTAVYEAALAHLVERAGDLDEARRLLESATDRLEEVGGTGDVRPHVRNLAARCLDHLAHVYDDLDLAEKARATRDRARRLLGPPPGTEP